MAKTKKKPAKSASKTPKKAAKKPVKSKAKKAVVKATAKAKPAKKTEAKVKGTAAAKTKKNSAKPPKAAKENLKAKKGTPVPKDVAEEVAKALDKKSKVAQAKVKKPKSDDEDFDGIEDELEEGFESFGDAIRLTPEDLEDPEDVVLTDAEGRRYCKVKDCDQLSSVEGYCRFHYLALWKRIQTRKKILADGKLEKYIEELTSRYPDKYIEMIRRDLKTEKDFLSAIQELEIDDSSDEGFEDDSGLIEEVRGMSPRGGRGSDDSGGSSDDY